MLLYLIIALNSKLKEAYRVFYICFLFMFIKGEADFVCFKI